MTSRPRGEDANGPPRPEAIAASTASPLGQEDAVELDPELRIAVLRAIVKELRQELDDKNEWARKLYRENEDLQVLIKVLTRGLTRMRKRTKENDEWWTQIRRLARMVPK